jgi:hypothetical protein
VSDPTVQAWARVLEDVDYRLAESAVYDFFKTTPDDYLQPGHVVKAVGEMVKFALQQEFTDESGWRSDPQPVCRDHDMPITECYPCCDVLAEKWFWGVDERHQWAVANLYKKEADLERV